MKIRSAGGVGAGARWANVKGSCAGSIDALTAKVKVKAAAEREEQKIAYVRSGQHRLK
jgi:hypothetical protein